MPPETGVRLAVEIVRLDRSVSVKVAEAFCPLLTGVAPSVAVNAPALMLRTFWPTVVDKTLIEKWHSPSVLPTWAGIVPEVNAMLVLPTARPVVTNRQLFVLGEAELTDMPLGRLTVTCPPVKTFVLLFNKARSSWTTSPLLPVEGLKLGVMVTDACASPAKPSAQINKNLNIL